MADRSGFDSTSIHASKQVIAIRMQRLFPVVTSRYFVLFNSFLEHTTTVGSFAGSDKTQGVADLLVYLLRIVSSTAREVFFEFNSDSF